MGRAANDQLTIVLTLKDRTPFTYRWMRYMDDMKCPYPILIADGGADSEVERHLQQPHNYPRLRYMYIRYPFDKNFGVYYQKLADAIDRVSTPYALLADNDDFYLLDNIPTFLRFLDDDETFVSCGGYPILLQLSSSDNEPVGSPSGADYSAAADTRPKSVTDGNGVARLCYFMTNVERYYLWSSWYHIHRTTALRQVARFIREHAFTDPVALEIHLHACLLMAGKYKAFDTPHLVAQLGASQSTSELNTAANLIERFIASNAFADIHASLDWLAPALSESERTTIHKAMARWFADQVFAVYPPSQERVLATATDDHMERAYRSLRRSLRPLKRLVRKQRAAPQAPLRLPSIEKYILECDRRTNA
jgi:glycosyltransferase domain-containing protein